MRNLSKTFDKLTIPLLVLLAISFFALPAHAKYGGGSGEPNDPYLIFDANQMNAIGADSNDWDKCFKLMADIDFGAYTGTEFNIIGDKHYDGGWVGTAFTGVFDGNGHTILNFTYDSNDRDSIGLFGYVDDPNAEIRNLGLIDPNVNAGLEDYVGPLVGLLGYYGTITNCYVRGGSVAGNYYVGGLAGHNLGTISNCYSESDVSGVELVGGLVGRNSYYPGPGAPCLSGKISNCYSTGSVTGDDFVGGLAGWDDCGEIIASFWDVNTSGQASSAGGTGKITSEMQTESTFTDAGWDFVDVWGICEGQDYPRLSWEKYGGGSGTAEKPYLIYNSCQMNAIGADSNDWDKHFKLMADIDLSCFSGTQYNIIGYFVIGDYKPFTGTFDGNGCKILNFTWDSVLREEVGLFGCVDGYSQIKNVGLENADVNALQQGYYVGCLVGLNSSGTITDCYSTGSVRGEGYIGGLVGENHGSITNCYSTATITGESGHMGGLVGYNENGTISRCYSTGDVLGGNYVGGLVGSSDYGMISKCYAISSANGVEDVGGLMGRSLHGTVVDCYSITNVQGSDAVGGLVGYHAYNTIINCYSTGPVDRDNPFGYFGGLVGHDRQARGSFMGCFWNVDSNHDPLFSGVGGVWPDPEGVIGQITVDMKKQGTFTSAGWDFVGETANGTDYIWRLCEDFVSYPRLTWEFPLGDFLCPDGVNFFDFSFFAAHWAEENCAVSNDCDGRDLDLLGSVDIKDLRIFADNWLAGF
jgi:hypothetical protein